MSRKRLALLSAVAVVVVAGVAFLALSDNFPPGSGLTGAIGGVEKADRYRDAQVTATDVKVYDEDGYDQDGTTARVSIASATAEGSPWRRARASSRRQGRRAVGGGGSVERRRSKVASAGGAIGGGKERLGKGVGSVDGGGSVEWRRQGRRRQR